MAQYIEIISKIKQKNNQTYKLMDLTDVEVNFPTDDYNVLCSSGSTVTKSGIDWDLNNNYCTIGGDLHISGNLYQNSDRTLKDNIIRITNSIGIVSSIEGVSFTWKSNGKSDYGVIAQDVQKVIPQMVSSNGNTGTKQVSYVKLIPFLVQSIKQLSARIEFLQNRNKSPNIFQKIKILFKNILG